MKRAETVLPWNLDDECRVLSNKSRLKKITKKQDQMIGNERAMENGRNGRVSRLRLSPFDLTEVRCITHGIMNTQVFGHHIT